MPKVTLLHWDPGSQHLGSPLGQLLLWAKSWRSCVSPLGLSCAQSQALPFSLLGGGPWGPIRLCSGQVTHPPLLLEQPDSREPLTVPPPLFPLLGELGSVWGSSSVALPEQAVALQFLPPLERVEDPILSDSM